MIYKRKTYKAIHNNLLSFMGEAHGYAFAIVTKLEDGTLLLATRADQPCYGELCFYGKDSRNFPNVIKPTDLFSPFPEGEPLEIFVPFPKMYLDSADTKFKHKVSLLLNVMYKNLKDYVTIHEDYEGTGRFVIHLHNTDVEPTLFLSFLSLVRSGRYLTPHENVEGLSEKEELLLHIFTSSTKVSEGYRYGLNNSVGEYYLSPRTKIKDILEGNNSPMTGGSFRERYSYDRKGLHNVFLNEGEGKEIGPYTYNTAKKTLEEHLEEIKELVACI